MQNPAESGKGKKSIYDDNGSIGGMSARGGSSSKKEKELEGVIEAMKRVVDKLKSENDRLKKTGEPNPNYP